MKKILCVIDMQNDFITGSLGNKEAEKILPSVINKIDSYKLEDVIVTMDTHNDEYLKTHEGRFLPIVHCVKPGDGWKLNEEVYKKVKGCKAIISKPSFGSYMLVDLIDQEYENDKDLTIEIIGLCTDVCVITNALLLRSAFPEVNIILDASCCAGSSPEKHKAALEVMRSCCIEVTGE